MSPVRLGLLSFAHVHSDGYAWAARVISEHDGAAQLVAIYDDDRTRGHQKMSQWDAKYFGDYNELLRSGAVDAVIIASENVHHADQVIAAAETGIHVICEKPVGISEADLFRMREALDKHPIIFQTAFVCRFSPAIIEAKKIIDGGTYGAIRAISATNHGRNPGGWFENIALSGGGAIIDHTVHAADAIRLLTGDEFTNIRAFRGKNLGPTNKRLESMLAGKDLHAEDNALIYARLHKSGVPVSIDCSWSRHEKWPTWGDLQMNIFCEKGVIKIDAFRPRINVSSTSGFAWQSVGEDLNVKLIRSFCEAIAEHKGESQPLPQGIDASSHNKVLRADFNDGARAAEVAFAAYKSIDAESEPVVQSY
jgi:UDP-N-acetylglucosamine 3-dehydrogenase